MTRTALTLCELNAHLGAVVREVRGGCGMSIDAVCDAVGQAGGQMHNPTLSWLERGKQRWTIEHLDAVAAALGIEPDVLVRMARVRRDREAAAGAGRTGGEVLGHDADRASAAG